MLTSMLLNELQKKSVQLDRLAAQVAKMSAQIKASHERELALQTAFDERMSKLEHEMTAKEGDRNVTTAFSR
jgi:hypothetical protein